MSTGSAWHGEDWILDRVLEKHPILGFGVHIWHFETIKESISYWPDGQWLLVLWSGGLAGLALHLSALYLVPAGSPTGLRSGNSIAVWSAKVKAMMVCG